MVTTCAAQIRNFNDIVLLLPQQMGVYTVFKLQTSQGVTWRVASVPDLYDWAQRKLGMDGVSFRRYMSEEVYEYSCLSVADTLLEPSVFWEIQKHDTVQKYMQRGQTDFLGHYFEGDKLKQKLLPHEFEALVATLFKWNIAFQNGHDSPGFYLVRQRDLWKYIAYHYPIETKGLRQVLNEIFED